MSKHDFPKYKYHPSADAVIVHSAEGEKELGDGWHDSPAHYGVETCPGVEPDEAIASKKHKKADPKKVDAKKSEEKKPAEK